MQFVGRGGVGGNRKDVVEDMAKDVVYNSRTLVAYNGKVARGIALWTSHLIVRIVSVSQSNNFARSELPERALETDFYTGRMPLPPTSYTFVYSAP